jgi:hypothetical protein
MAGVPGAQPSVNEASFTGQTQEQFSGRPPWMAEVPKTQEQFSGRWFRTGRRRTLSA